MSEFYCDLTAIPPEVREQHIKLAENLLSRRSLVRELPDGFALQFAGDAETLLQIVQFITLERLCCPFFRLMLEAEPQHGATWLHITGEEGIKPFIVAELGL